MKNLLASKKAELEQMLVDYELKLDEEEEKSKRSSQEKNKLQQQIASLDDQ